MTPDEILRLVVNKADISRVRMDEPDRYLYQDLLDIYSRYRAGTLSKEVCSQMKTAAIQRREAFIARVNEVNAVRRERGEFWQRVERAATLFAKQQTLEAANDFYEAVYRMRPLNGGNGYEQGE